MNENVKIHTYIHTDRRTDILRHTEGEGGWGEELLTYTKLQVD